MKVTINGQPIDTDAVTLGELIGIMSPGSAVAINGEVVRRTDVAGHRLGEGDRVELVQAVAGG